MYRQVVGGLAALVEYGQSACSGMVPGHSLGQGTGVQRYGKRMSNAAEPQSRRGIASEGGRAKS